MDQTRRSEGSVNMAETVKLKTLSGREFEVNVKAAMRCSGLLRELIGEYGTDAPINVPLHSDNLFEITIRWCEIRYKFWLATNPTEIVSEDRQLALPTVCRFEPFHNVYETPHEDERSWEEKECGAEFLNKHCGKYDYETIKGLHEAAKFLDIPSLLRLTTPLIRGAPSREFMSVVSPWLDYNTLEAFRDHEMAVC